jgi:hypothetical protein
LGGGGFSGRLSGGCRGLRRARRRLCRRLRWCQQRLERGAILLKLLFQRSDLFLKRFAFLNREVEPVFRELPTFLD